MILITTEFCTKELTRCAELWLLKAGEYVLYSVNFIMSKKNWETQNAQCNAHLFSIRLEDLQRKDTYTSSTITSINYHSIYEMCSHFFMPTGNHKHIIDSMKAFITAPIKKLKRKRKTETWFSSRPTKYHNYRV